MQLHLVRTVWLLAALVASSVQAQDSATLKMKIIVKGITPEPQSYSLPAVGKIVSGNLVVGANGELCRPGQAISFANAGPIGHHLSFSSLRNFNQAVTIAPGVQRQLTFKEVEPRPIMVNCDIYPWTKAFVIVQKHSCVGVSNADGVVEITGLPLGEKLVFRVWHEAGAGIDRLYVNDKPQELLRGSRWELDLKPGINDLGVVKISNKFFWNR